MDFINITDICVIILFVISAVVGIARGFTREFFGVVAWVGAAIAAIYGMIWARPYVQTWIEHKLIADVVSGLVIFIIVLFLLGTATRYLSKKVKSSALGGLDRSLGLVFGLLRAAFLLIVAYFVATLIWKDKETWPKKIKEARSYPYVVDATKWLGDKIPAEAIENFEWLLNYAEEGQSKDSPVSSDQEVQDLSQPKPSSPDEDEAESEDDEDEE